MVPVDLLLKDLLMTAFGRGPKTMQRWFRAGVVPNAYRTKGAVRRAGNYRIKTPAGTTRQHVVRWKDLLVTQHSRVLGRSLTRPMGVVLHDADEHDFPVAFRGWCIHAQTQIGHFMEKHARGRRWPKAEQNVRRRRKTTSSSVASAGVPASVSGQ